MTVVREYDPSRDLAGVEDVERRCEVGPGGKLSLFTDLLGDPICRIRHSPSFLMLVAEFRVVRASLFFGMGFSGAAPILHKLIIFWDQPEALRTTGYEVLMGLLYGLGALVYATRIPERWMPGKFDIAGHSHQLFHVLVVAGAFTHYRAGLVYLKWRDVEGC